MVAQEEKNEERRGMERGKEGRKYGKKKRPVNDLKGIIEDRVFYRACFDGFEAIIEIEWR